LSWNQEREEAKINNQINNQIMNKLYTFFIAIFLLSGCNNYQNSNESEIDTSSDFNIPLEMQKATYGYSITNKGTNQYFFYRFFSLDSINYQGAFFVEDNLDSIKVTISDSISKSYSISNKTQKTFITGCNIKFVTFWIDYYKSNDNNVKVYSTSKKLGNKSNELIVVCEDSTLHFNMDKNL
jgi:hypothetical protein